MGDMVTTLKASADVYPAVGLIGFMTVSLMLALILIGLGVRFIRTISALKSYDAALEKIRSIEDQLADMTAAMHEVEMDYERSLAEEKSAHDREVFSLQQTIFDRNAEILTLKTELLDLRRNPYPYDTYSQ